MKQTPADQLFLFGTVAGDKLVPEKKLYRITRLCEKPTAAYARENLVISGLANDHFLAFFGIYLFTPTIFDVLKFHLDHNVRQNGEIQLATAQDELVNSEGAFATEIDGERLDMGTPLGYIETQIRLALAGELHPQVEEIITRALQGKSVEK